MVYLENIWLLEISIFLKPKWLKNTVRWEVQTLFFSSCEWMLSRVNDNWPTCWWEVRRRQPKLMHWLLVNVLLLMLEKQVFIIHQMFNQNYFVYKKYNSSQYFSIWTSILR